MRVVSDSGSLWLRMRSLSRLGSLLRCRRCFSRTDSGPMPIVGRLLPLLLALPATIAVADIGDAPRWSLTFSNQLTHYRSDPEHHERPGLVGFDYTPQGSEWMIGGATFRNSFRQRSMYAYTGRRFSAVNSPAYLQITTGLIAGYRGEYRNKLPLNTLGVAPAVVPSVGIEMNGYRGEIIVLGNAALMLGWGADF